MELREGAIIAERFRLIRLLGKGGMGDVWAAQHMALDIPCAVKFIHAESAEKAEVRERFEREAKAAAQLRSPNVVHILDYGIYENMPYLAMEYLDGEPLNARIKRRGRLDAHETYRIVSGVGRALTKAHAAGIVHRDLKPENIFLVPDEEGEVAKVLDFGVAKRTTQLDSNTRTGALLGTPYYMSPEQAQGIKQVDHRADLWSLAVVAFRAITGELPFKSDALGDLLIRIVTQPPPVPSHVCPGLPDSFDRWWHRASQREPEHRYQTAKELCDALGLALGVSMPSHLGGNTPMPGLMAPSLPNQTVAFQNDPPHGQALPFGAGAVSAHGSYSSMTASSGTNHSPGISGAPGVAGSPLVQAAQQAAFAHAAPLGDSGALASVAGISAATNPKPSGSKKVAVIGVFATVFLVAGAGAFFLTRTPQSSASGSSSSQPAAASAASSAATPAKSGGASTAISATATATASAAPSNDAAASDAPASDASSTPSVSGSPKFGVGGKPIAHAATSASAKAKDPPKDPPKQPPPSGSAWGGAGF
jgi:serine/threonine-protein kinase